MEKPLARTLLVAAAAASLALSGCGAGQVTQTDVMVAPVPGASGDLVDSADHVDIALRDVTVVYSAEGYSEGDSAPLAVRIFNDGREDDVLESVSSPQAGSVSVVEIEPGEAASEDEDEDAEDAESGIAVIPAGGYVLLTPEHALYIQLDELEGDVEVGQLIPVTFTFAEAGETELNVPLPPPAGGEELDGRPELESFEGDDSEH